MGIWRWIDHEGQTLRNIGILRDGTLVTNGYSEELVRAAIAAAKQRQHERRSNAAKKAAETRRRRRELLMTKITALVINGQRIGPLKSCCLCGKKLADAQSIARGVGPECWQDLLTQVEVRRAAAAQQERQP
jgi:Family of unknown function (DUF6011)